MHDSIHRTLILRFSSIGDIVLSSLLLRTLHARFPDSRIDFLLKEEYAELLRYNPHINELLVFPSGGDFSALKRLRRQIKKRNYDLIVDIHDNLRSRFICLGARRAVRYKKRRIARFMLVHFKWNPYAMLGGAPNVALRYLEPLHEFNVNDDGEGIEVFITENHTQRCTALLQEHGIDPQTKLIGICPFARHGNKQWIHERFIESATQLSEKYKAGVIIFGSGAKEMALGDNMAKALQATIAGLPVFNSVGKLSLAETAAMMDHCSIIVANDSALMHIAAARKRKLVAIFGPTVEQFGFYPFRTDSKIIENTGLYCRPCTPIGLPECPLGHFRCMREIHSARVIAAAHELIAT